MYLSVELMVVLMILLWELKILLSGNGRKRIGRMLIPACCVTLFAGLAWLQYDYRYGLYPERAVNVAVLLWIPPIVLGLQRVFQRVMLLIKKEENKL